MGPRILTTLVAVASLLVLTQGTAAVAVGGGPAPKDPPGLVDDLSVTSSSEVVAPGSGVTAADPEARAKRSRCQLVTTRAAGKSLGVITFWVQQRVTWCFTGSKITFRFRYPTQSYANGYLFWSDDDEPDVQSTAGIPWRVSLVKRFRHCPPLPWDVGCSNKYADIDMVLRATGKYELAHTIR